MPKKPKRRINQRSKKIDKITNLEKSKAESLKLKKFLAKAEWAEFVQPLIDKMIVDTIGGIGEGGFWSSGIVGQPEGKQVATEYLLGYRMALIDFNNRLRHHAGLCDKIDTQIEELKQSKPKPEAVISSWSYSPVGTTS